MVFKTVTFMNIKSALSFGVLTGAALWAFTQCYTDYGTEDYWTCSNIAFVIIAFHGMVGFCKYGQKKPCTRNPKLYKPISIMASIYSVPLICVDMYLYNNFAYEMAYLHLMYPIMAFAACYKQHRINKKAIDMVNFSSLMSYSFISAMSKNYYGLAAAICHTLANYVLTSVGKSAGLHGRDAKNYLTAVFVFLSLKALVLAEQRWLIGGAMSFDFNIAKFCKKKC